MWFAQSIQMFAACKAALPHIRKTQGNIINLSSLVGSMAQDKAVTYVATKVRPLMCFCQ